LALGPKLGIRKKTSYFWVAKLKIPACRQAGMSHLTLFQRYEISILKEQKLSMSAIADRVGTSKSTISRELGRNSDGRGGGYRAELAQKKCDRTAPSGKEQENSLYRGCTELCRALPETGLQPGTNSGVCR